MASRAELEDIIARQTAALKLQADRIVELDAEVARLNGIIEGSSDALQTLQRIYTDRSNPVSTIMRAAAEAVPYERSRLPTLSVNADITGLADRLQAAREEYLSRCKVVDGKTIYPED
jgi:hypothetical protein